MALMRTVEDLKKPPAEIYFVGVGGLTDRLGATNAKVYRSKSAAKGKLTRHYPIDDCVLYLNKGAGWELIDTAIWPDTCAVCDSEIRSTTPRSLRNDSHIVRISNKALWHQPVVCMRCWNNFYAPRPKIMTIQHGWRGGKMQSNAIVEGRAYYSPTLF